MTNDIDLHVGKRLRRRRRLLGLTQQTLAEQVGIRFQQIQKYECGANRVSAARLFELSEALSVRFRMKSILISSLRMFYLAKKQWISYGLIMPWMTRLESIS